MFCFVNLFLETLFSPYFDDMSAEVYKKRDGDFLSLNMGRLKQLPNEIHEETSELHHIIHLTDVDETKNFLQQNKYFLKFNFLFFSIFMHMDRIKSILA